MRNRATTGDGVPEACVAGTGFERTAFTTGNSHIERPGSAKCSALLPHSTTTHDEGLAEVIAAWTALPAALKSDIMAIVRAARGG